MSIILQANSTAIFPGNSTSFGASGGTPPYTYSVLPGGAGGMIDSGTGLYTAPSIYGTDTVQVIDSLLATATLPIIIGDALIMLCDVIERELELQNDQVWIWNQKVNIPKDQRLYVGLSVLSCKPFSNSNYFDTDGNSIQSVNMYATVSIDIFSRSTLALSRKEEIILALNSNYAQAQQELNSFYIAKVSSGFVNLSQEEGAAILYRYNISVNVQYFIKKIKAVTYYDTFSDAIVEQTEE